MNIKLIRMFFIIYIRCDKSCSTSSYNVSTHTAPLRVNTHAVR